MKILLEKRPLSMMQSLRGLRGVRLLTSSSSGLMRLEKRSDSKIRNYALLMCSSSTLNTAFWVCFEKTTALIVTAELETVDILGFDRSLESDGAAPAISTL